MRKNDFKEWLLTHVHTKPASDCVSRCGTVEAALNVDLDEEYARDQCMEVINKMQYTAKDERENKKAPEGFHFRENAKIRYRLTDLRSAVKKYVCFCNENIKK